MDFVETLKEYREEETNLIQKVQQLTNDCLQFELPVPSLTLKTIDWNVWEVLLEYIASMKVY